MNPDLAKYARLEYERRWLVDSSRRPELADAGVTLIHDRYIDGTRVRLRRMDRHDLGQTTYKLTRKYETDVPSARPITSFYLTPGEYEVLAALPASDVVKRRFHFRHRGASWSLDLFEGALAGLEIVECEADSAKALEMLDPPRWVLREVTDLAQWQCGALGAHGIPED